VSAAGVIWFVEPACREASIAGGKGASLAAMTAAGLPVPPGFVVCASTLEWCVDSDRLRQLARARAHEEAQALVLVAEPPRDGIMTAYDELGGGRVAVRSSATAEDSEAASFAGQQETFLDVQGAADVCTKVVECWASFFSERALFYRGHKGSLDDLGMAVVVQQMVDAEKAGVIFTVDPVQRRRDQMIVEAVLGLGEQVVSGEMTPAHYVLDRAGTVKREVLAGEGVLSADELRELAVLGQRLEEHFGSPQDVEWAIVDGRVFLLQSRPVTTL
jgi:pyruvate,water dikinase